MVHSGSALHRAQSSWCCAHHAGERGLPAELQAVESGAMVRVLEVEFEGGEKVVVPRANVELIEE